MCRLEVAHQTAALGVAVPVSIRRALLSLARTYFLKSSPTASYRRQCIKEASRALTAPRTTLSKQPKHSADLGELCSGKRFENKTVCVVSSILARLRAPAAGCIRLAGTVRECLKSQNNTRCDRREPHRKKVGTIASTVLVTAVPCVEACS